MQSSTSARNTNKCSALLEAAACWNNHGLQKECKNWIQSKAFTCCAFACVGLFVCSLPFACKHELQLLVPVGRRLPGIHVIAQHAVHIFVEEPLHAGEHQEHACLQHTFSQEGMHPIMQHLPQRKYNTIHSWIKYLSFWIIHKPCGLLPQGKIILAHGCGIVLQSPQCASQTLTCCKKCRASEKFFSFSNQG